VLFVAERAIGKPAVILFPSRFIGELVEILRDDDAGPLPSGAGGLTKKLSA
jgi:hypothetical protein